MKNRLIWFSLSCVSLFIGMLLYGFCRTDTYIGNVVGHFLDTRILTTNPLYGFLAWYFPDYLWMFSLNCALFGILLPRGKNVITWCAVALSWGILWEIAQWLDVVSGTGDLWDIFMYLTAVFSAGAINILKRGN